jgi:hypothetical protein
MRKHMLKNHQVKQNKPDSEIQASHFSYMWNLVGVKWDEVEGRLLGKRRGLTGRWNEGEERKMVEYDQGTLYDVW